MKAAQITAEEAVVAAFESLPKSKREEVLRLFFSDPALKRNLLDIASWLQRRRERSVPYKKARSSLKKAGRLWVLIPHEYFP